MRTSPASSSDASRWWLAAVTQPGTRHVLAGKPCEDAACIEANDEGSFVLVACDGAGTRTHARAGARAVARVVARLLLANAGDVMARKLTGDIVIDVARSELAELAAAEGGGAAPRDFATTLVALLVHDGYAMTCHVGDGAIFALEGEHPRCISPPDRGEGSTATRFVTCERVLPRMWLYPVPPYATGFLVVTDGAQPALYNATTHACSHLVARALNRFDLADGRGERERLLLDLVGSSLQTRSGDDITLVGARRAFVAGVYGCPECKLPAVEPRMRADGQRYFGICRACRHLVFAHDAHVAEAQRRHAGLRQALGRPAA